MVAGTLAGRRGSPFGARCHPLLRAVVALLCVALWVQPAFAQSAQAFTFTDDPLTAQTTPIKAVHINELRAAVNTLRSQAGLATFSFTDLTLTASSTHVRAVHITELRHALDMLYDAVGQARPSYTDSTLSAGQTPVKRLHIAELRSAINGVTVFGITSLGSSSLPPAKLLTINGAGFDPAADMTAIFTDSANRSVEVPALDVTTTSLKAPVPPFINTAGQLSSGTVAVKVKKLTTLSNTISGFQILAAPSSPLAAGALIKAQLNGVRSQGLLLKTESFESSVETGLDTNISHATQLIGKIQSVVNDPSLTFSLGTLDGQTLTVGANELAAIDRMLLAHIQSLAAQPSADAVMFATSVPDISTACLAAEADAVSQAVANGTDPDIAKVIHGARAKAACASPVAFNTTNLLIGGAGAIAVGSLALLGATPMALALSGAALLYITITLAGGQIAIGGAANQPSASDGQLVQQGAKQLNDLLEDLLLPKIELPGTVGDIKTIVNGIKTVSDAFEGTSLPPPSPAPTPPAVTGIAFLSTGSTTSAQVTPVLAGVSVYHSLSGTDGFTQSGTLTTDSSGVVSFGVPAGAAGVVDTVIVTVVGGPSATTSHTWDVLPDGVMPRIVVQ